MLSKSKSIKYAIIFVLFCFISIVRLNVVSAVSYETDGSSVVTTGSKCDLVNGNDVNGCLGDAGWYVSVIKNYTKSASGINYRRVTNKTEYYSYNVGDLEEMMEDITDGGWRFEELLEELGVTTDQFFNNNYYILLEPLFTLHYWLPDLDCNGDYYCYKTSHDNYVEADMMTGKQSAQRMKSLYGRGPYLGTLNKNFACMAFVRYPNKDSYDSLCDPSASSSKMQDYWNAAINNSRYGVSVISASEITRTGSITIIKEVDDLETYNNYSRDWALFHMYPNSNCSGNIIVGSFFGDPNEPYVLDYLEEGWYSIKEESGMRGYEEDTTCRRVYLSAGENKTITIKNYEKRYNLKIKKTDQYGQLVTNGSAKFELYEDMNCESGNLIKTFNTVNGTYTIPSLRFGYYSIKEISAPDGYEKEPYCQLICIPFNYSQSTYEHTVENKKLEGSLVVIKKDQNNKQIENSATFSLYKGNNCTGDVQKSFSVVGMKILYNLNVGDYSIKEIVAPEGYKLDQTCHSFSIKDAKVSTLSVVNEEIKKYGTLKLLKKDENGNLIVKNEASFNYYKSSDCTGTAYPINVTGSKEIQLEVGEYSIQETKAPSTYTLDSTCRKFSINKDEPTELSISNFKGCTAEFNALSESDKINPLKRIELFQKYEFKNEIYTNLLDFKNIKTPCRSDNVTKSTLNTGCLSAEMDVKRTFESENLSGYNANETITITGNDGNTYKGYCNITFKLHNNLKGNYSYTKDYKFLSSNENNKFKSGQMVLSRSTPNIAQGTLTKTCYVYGINSEVNILSINDSTMENYSAYISSVKFNDVILKYNINPDNNEWTKEFNSNYVKLTKNIVATYDLLPVYLENGSGKPNSTNCDICKFLGYGFATTLDKQNGDYTVPFSLTVQSKLDLSQTTYSSNNNCTYSIENEITEPDPDPNKPRKLNIEFREIDTKNPFPGKNGIGRTVGTNWCDETKNCKENNLRVQEVMNRTNSFNKKGNLEGDGPIYSIRLTPEIIKNIRDQYNKNRNYDDYTLECGIDGCKSTFLRDFLKVSKNK